MEAPLFLSGLRDQEITEEEDCQFSVEVTGKPTPVVEWYVCIFSFDNCHENLICATIFLHWNLKLYQLRLLFRDEICIVDLTV